MVTYLNISFNIQMNKYKYSKISLSYIDTPFICGCL
jgi:hypothetical protein